MVEKVKYASIVVLMMFIIACSSSIPKNDNVYNNCIACRMVSNDGINNECKFSWINMIDSEGCRYKALPISSGFFANNKNYYCLFNVKPGVYYIDSAEMIEEEYVSPAKSVVSQNVSGDCGKTYVINFIFINNTNKKLMIEIRENVFSYIGSILYLNTSSLKQRIIPDVVGTYTNTIEIVSWEDKNITHDLNDLLIVFKNTYWEKLILDQKRFVQ
jgi:hypothetical protein